MLICCQSRDWRQTSCVHQRGKKMYEAIKASEQNLNKVFSNEYLFQIPLYQRPYAWTTEEVSELLDDLLFAMDKDPEAPYFLGSIVLIKGEDPYSEVIDGQ